MRPEEWIRREIKKRKLTYRRIAKETGISYYRIQAGSFTPGQYLSLCALLELDPRGFRKEG